MRPTAWQFLAAVSLVLAAATPLAAQVRPQYGGTLRVQMHAQVNSLDPAEPAASADQALARERLGGLVFDSLVRLDERGWPQPHLALSSQHDADWKQWQFRLRAGVKFHDGTPLTPSAVAASLEAVLSGRRVSVFGDTLLIQADAPMRDLLTELAGSRGWVLRRKADGGLVGTGPFRIEQWEAGTRAVFAANEDYWGGRAYLDSVEVQMGRPLREQMIDLELGKADLVEVALEQARRLSQDGLRIWASPPVEWMALVFAADASRDAETMRLLSEALALATDRAAIHNVLLQRQGEPAGGLLPQWLSGYAFLFSTAVDVERASQLVAKAAGPAPPRGRAAVTLALAYDAGDALARVVAERIAVNARDAGITLQTVARDAPAASSAPVRLVRLRIRAASPRAALAELGAALGLDEFARLPEPAAAEELYEAERAVVESHRVIPLFHLPEVFGLSAGVRNWQVSAAAAATGVWRLEDIWLAPGAGEGKP
jgi:ABC-type transport system substrate-binding protein